jgi:hypothetical protein
MFKENKYEFSQEAFKPELYNLHNCNLFKQELDFLFIEGNTNLNLGPGQKCIFQFDRISFNATYF